MIPFDFVITFPFPYGIDTLKYRTVQQEEET